ncbi:hypothetical protein CFC21_073498 [Triticum aestivum]|uniref:DUF1677 family protein n=3 Tax=Triticum TaxID=4564 RepID=A0A9R0XH30_TRITD|nr:uncharacterized protein LOC119306221 [Triticum dicoccoides]XP_044393760.1 uncharacterized protein LOC123116962 [Triticum aestivum]KAF7067635.1 hypothetical protein CFC21_073498 [Triticum aestivum]VAI36610.1 unnamed protein product [Triticum turgidum subsp. durum]
MEAVESSAVVSCECCGLGEECTGEYIVRVRAYFGGRWLCGLCSESVKYEAGRSKRAAAMGVEEAVRAHMAFCRMLRRGGPAERVAEGICQMLRRRTAFGNCRVAISSSLSWRTTPAPVALASGPHNRASMEPLSIGL